MGSSATATARKLSTTALNRAIAKQSFWCVVDRFSGDIFHFRHTRRDAREMQVMFKNGSTVIRRIDVRVTGVRA